MQEPAPTTSKHQVAVLSLLASGGLAALKFVAAFFTGSLALYTEALHSLTDFAATLMTLIAVRIGDKPADDDHHYGHAKVESLAALIETAMLVGLASVIAYEAVSRLIRGADTVTFSWWAVAILVVSVVVDYNRSRALSQTATQTSSAALAADAVHFSADMWSSAAVLVGLFAVYLGYQWADPLIALLVAAMIARAAVTLGISTVNTLTDRVPEGITEQIKSVVSGHKGVLAVQQLRAKEAGPKLFVTLVVDVARTLPVQDIVRIKNEIADAVRSIHPAADVTVSSNPVAVDDETAFDKVYLIARRQGLAIHHLTVQDLEGRLAVSFDLEVDGQTSLQDAHLAATRLEYEIRETLGENVEVESHIEPLPPATLSGREADVATLHDIIRTLNTVAGNRLSEIHNVRVRETNGELFVHYHCRFAPEASVKTIHGLLDDIEAELKAKITKVGRVVAHAEPIGAPKHVH